MPGINISADISAVIKGLDKTKANAEKVVRSTISDTRKRAPGWIRKVVQGEYNVKPKDINEALKVSSGGTASFAGVTVDNLVITYSGRTLTAVHFGMSPTAASSTREKKPRLIPADRLNVNSTHAVEGRPPVAWARPLKQKPVTAIIKKGSKKTLHSKTRPSHLAFLIRGKKPPFQRSGDYAAGVDAVRSLSVPQMVARGEDIERGGVKPEIEDVLNKNINERFKYHCDRLL